MLLKNIHHKEIKGMFAYVPTLTSYSRYLDITVLDKTWFPDRPWNEHSLFLRACCGPKTSQVATSVFLE